MTSPMNDLGFTGSRPAAKKLPAMDMRMDLETPLETAGKAVLVIGILMILFAAFTCFSSGAGSSGRNLAWFFPGGASVIIGFFLIKNTDCYYVLKPRLAKIIYHRKFFEWTWRKDVASFAMVDRIEIQGEERCHRRSRRSVFGGHRHYEREYYNMFWISLILKSGKEIVFSNRVRGNGHIPPEYKSRAQKAAELIGCHFEYNGRFKEYGTFRLPF